MLTNTVAKSEVKEEGLDSNPSGLHVASTNFSKVKSLTPFLPGVRYNRALLNFMDIQFHEHVNAFVGIGAEELLNL